MTLRRPTTIAVSLFIATTAACDPCAMPRTDCARYEDAGESPPPAEQDAGDLDDGGTHTDAGIDDAGTEAQFPRCVAEIARVNGAAFEEGTAIHVGDDVVVTLAHSDAGGDGRAITSATWEITERPAESAVFLLTPDSIETHLTSGGEAVAVDRAGQYRLQGTVTNDLHLTSMNECFVLFVVVE